MWVLPDVLAGEDMGLGLEVFERHVSMLMQICDGAVEMSPKDSIGMLRTGYFKIQEKALN